MAYVVDPSSEFPEFLNCAENDFETVVPDIDRRAELSNIFLYGGALLVPDEMPNFMRIANKIEVPPDIFSSFDGIVIANDRMRRGLEELDPGVHQFIPITVYLKSKELAEGSWYILNVHYKQDSVVDELSNVRPMSHQQPNTRPMMVIKFKRRDNQVTIDRSKLSGVNLWREAGYLGAYFLSDQLHSALSAQKIKFLSMKTVIEIN
jgi:hypothetical protein